MHTFDLIRFYHDRPETSLATWEGDSLVDAKLKAMTHIKTLRLGHDASVAFTLFCNDHPTYCFDSTSKVVGSQLPDCEACDDEADDPSAFDTLGADLCLGCAAEWDDDNARSNGPHAEIERLRESRN